MDTEKGNALDIFQKQIEAAREISEVLFEGTGRIENILLDEWRRIVEEQLKFFQATAAVRDFQGLATLHSAMFSHAPDEFFKAQREMVNISVETQSRVYNIINQCTGSLSAGITPVQAPPGGENLASGLYGLWQKSFQDAIGLAALTAKSMPPAMLGSLDTSLGQKGNTHGRRRPASA